MSSELPVGFQWRRPRRDDAEAILAVMDRHNTPLIGSPDITLAQVCDELCEPGFDPERDAWLVRDAAGVDVAYGWAFRKGSSDMVDVDVYADDEAAAAWLWTQVLTRAQELGAAVGHEAITIDIGIYQNDEAQRARARSRGFAPVTTFQRMRIDFDGPPPEPAVPAGVVVRTGPGDEAFRRDAHHVLTRAFAEHFGYLARSFEEWHEAIEAASTSDWAQVRVAYVDGEPVAMVRGSDQFDDEDCGYIPTVAVLPAARGRGLAKLLLLQAFVDDFARGRRGTVLHVDSNNVTPAVGLYEHVGMRTVLGIDIWQARAPTG